MLSDYLILFNNDEFLVYRGKNGMRNEQPNGTAVLYRMGWNF